MALFHALAAALTRSAGKVLNTAFGWATVMLFGKVPEDRQIYLSIMSFGSVAWLAVVIGIAFPTVGTFLLAFVPLPEWVNDNMVRLIMLGMAILIPLLVGLIGLKMLDAEDRPPDAAGKAKAVLKGYPYTLGLALTLVLMLLFAPFLKLRTLVRRWTTEHVPMIVEGQDYRQVVGEMQQALANAGWQTTRQRASWMLRLPTRVLTGLAGGAIESFVAENLTTLRGECLEVTLHPSDLVVSGKEADVAHARAVVAEQLAFSSAYMTWTKEANKLEDRVEVVCRGLRSGQTDPRAALQELDRVEEELKREKISYEEWEVLFRQKLLAERLALGRMAGIPSREEPAGEAAAAQAAAAAPATAATRTGARPAGILPGILVFLASVVTDRLRSRGRRARS